MYNKIIKTQSGSTYYLSERDGRTFLMKGLLIGEVVKFNEEVKVGGVLDIEFLKETLYGTTETLPTWLRTTPITEIREV